MPRTTRRQAIVSIAAGLSAGSLPGQQAYRPVTFSQDEFDLLGIVVDLILPESGTPGARQVGVHAMLDEDLAKNSDGLSTLRKGLAGLREAGFQDLTHAQRVSVLTAYSDAEGPEKEFFEAIKGLTVDAYYSTEVGLVQELGYQGNTYLEEFPGCTHDHQLEDTV